MTLFAVACAGMFPILHLGRPWLAYWLIPYPNTMWLWPQLRSPLIWDVHSRYPLTRRRCRGHFLVHRADSRFPRRCATSGRRPAAGKILRPAGNGLARIGQALGAISKNLFTTRRIIDAAGGIGVHWWSASILQWQFCRAGTRPFFPPYFVAGAIYLRVRHGIDAGVIPVRRWCITWKTSDHHAAHRMHGGEGDAWHRVDCEAYGYAMEAFMALGIQRINMSAMCVFQSRVSTASGRFLQQHGTYWWTYRRWISPIIF